MKLSKINSIEVELLNEADREHGRCIIRSMGPNYYCTLLIPLLTTQKNENKDNNNFWKQMMEGHQQKYILSSKLRNASFLIQNYNFTYEQNYLKIDQEFYPKTLYSIKPGAISYDQKLKIMIKMAHILNYLHSHNICLRVFCPQSVAYFQEKYDIQLKLIWLEEAIRLEGNTGMTNQVMSYIPADISSFVAPEIKLKKSYGFKADVWSLGVIFYRLIFGHTQGIIIQNQTVSVKYPPNFPQFLSNILNSFLHQDPKERCSLSTCISYLKPLKQCAEATSKMLENVTL